MAKENSQAEKSFSSKPIIAIVAVVAVVAIVLIIGVDITGEAHKRRVSPQPPPSQQTPDRNVTQAASLMVSSVPSGALVYLDAESEPRGRTPITIKNLAPGTHELRVWKEEFLAMYTKSVNIPANRQLAVHAKLEEAQYYSRIAPTLNARNTNFTVYVSSKTPITTKLYALVFAPNNSLVKSVELFNDGQHNDDGANDGTAANVFQLPNTGNYSARLCLGNSPTTCKSFTGRMNFAVDELECRAMRPYLSHNKAANDRINMVIVGSGYQDTQHFAALADKVLAFDGNPKVVTRRYVTKDSAGQILTDSSESIPQFGIFSIEPFKSNKNKFNIWILNKQLDGSFHELIDKTMTFGRENYFPFCNLKNVYPVLFVNKEFDPRDVFGGMDPTRSHAYWPSFRAELENALNSATPDKTTLKFGMSLNSFPLIKPESRTEYDPKQRRTITIQSIFDGVDTPKSYSILAHETGHALFGLSDEYYGGSQWATVYAYPNCAESQMQAQKWWGNLVGQVDPFYYEFKAFMEKNGQMVLPESAIKVGYVNGGCFTVPYGQSGVIRPSENSMMLDHRSLPVFGSVNRKMAEDILQLFSG